MSSGRLLLLALVACGDNRAPPITAEPQSGTRLRLERVVYEDGTRQLASADTVFDRDRGESCTIKQWSDGLRYCTPATYRNVFADDTCTEEIARRRSVEPDRLYALHEFVVAGAALPSRLYELGAEIPRDQVTDTFELRNGSCVLRTDTADQDRFYTLGDEVDRSRLVHTIRVEVETGDRLVALVDTSADGLRLPTRLFDDEQQRECSLVTRADGSAACELEGVAVSIRFADDACTVPAVIVPASMPLPDLARRQHGLGCDTFHDLAQLILAPTSYTKSGDVCTEAPLEIGERVFGVGPPIDIALLDRRRVPGERRLQVIEVGDSRFPDPKLFDAELQQECSVLDLDTLRCVPASERGRDAFSDPGCSTPILVLEVAPQCNAVPTVVRSTSSFNAPFHPVLGPISDVFEITTGDRCAPALRAFEGSTFHLTGDEIGAAAFVRAKREID